MSEVKDRKMRTYSSDLLAVQRLFQNVIRKQQGSNKVTQHEAIDLLHQLNVNIQRQSEELEAIVEELGSDFRKEIKTRFADITGIIGGILDTGRQDPVSKMVRDDYVSLSLLMVGYEMLHTTALIRQEQRLADLTQKHMNTLAQLISETGKVLPVVVAKELSGNHEKAADIGKRAVENVQKAWSSENVHSGSNVTDM